MNVTGNNPHTSFTGNVTIDFPSVVNVPAPSPKPQQMPKLTDVAYATILRVDGGLSELLSLLIKMSEKLTGTVPPDSGQPMTPTERTSGWFHDANFVLGGAENTLRRALEIARYLEEWL